MQQTATRSIFALIMLFVLSAQCLATDKMPLAEDWQFRQGDNPAWSTALLDDNAWDSVNVPQLLFQGHGKPVIGWYRVHFNVVNPDIANRAILIETIRHADETWLNGIKIGGLGETYSAWDFFHTNPQSLPRLYKIPDDLLQSKNNVLVIKTNVGFGQAWGAMFPGGAGITKGGVYLGDYDQLLEEVHKTELQIITLDSIFAVLGLVDLLLIILLIKTALGPVPEFRWLVVSSFFLLVGAAAHDINYVYSMNLISTNFAMIIAMLILPYSTAMYFWSQYRDLNSRYITILTFSWALGVITLLLPGLPPLLKEIAWYFWNIHAVLFFLYAIIAAFKGLLYQRIGAYAQFFGIIIYVVSIRSQWLPDELFGHRNIQFGSLIYRYALLFAYFQQLTHIRLAFKKLSARVVGITEDVRHSMARELHDGIGQYLASAKLQINLAQDPDRENKHLQLTQSEIQQAVRELRRMINGLHPVVLDKAGLIKALQSECDSLNKVYGIAITLDAKDTKIAKQNEIHIFRILQECITNSIKHGESTRIKIRLSTQKGYVVLSIADNGKGFDINNTASYRGDGGFGFISLQERITLLNGRIDIFSELGKGSQVYIKFPIADN